MTLKTELIVRELAAYYQLRIEFVSDLPSAVPGLLDTNSASPTILVNANKPKSDQVFTILHKTVHFAVHFEKSHGGLDKLILRVTVV